MTTIPGGNGYYLEPGGIGRTEFHGSMPIDVSIWRPAFDYWINTQTAGYKWMSEAAPIRVIMAWSVLRFHARADPDPFVRSFGRLVRFTMQARRLAASALWTLGQTVGHPTVPVTVESVAAYEPGKPQTYTHVNELQPGRLMSHSFLGVHLRVEVDVPFDWTTYDVQAAAYINEARRRKSRVIFVATGSPEVT